MKTAILLNNLGPNQLAYTILKNQYPCTLFIKNIINPCIGTNKVVSLWHEAWSFDNTIIATDIESAKFLINLPCKKRYYYVSDLMRMNDSYLNIINILQSSKLEIIARSETHKKYLEDYANIKISRIMQDLEYEKL